MYFSAIVLVLGLLLIPQPAPASKNTDIVLRWAEALGDELWNLGTKLTKLNEIKHSCVDKHGNPNKPLKGFSLRSTPLFRYNELHIKVKRKNEVSILQSAVDSVGRMLQRKIDAVKCIHHKAEELARNFLMTDEKKENFTYCSSKYSYAEIKDGDMLKEVEDLELKRPQCAVDNIEHYSNLTLNEDSHFYGIAVDTERSCVQVPTNIYDQEADALEAILWSEELDTTFQQNYESDPSLTWQYFGSSTGILRLYPAMPWNKLTTDVFDCRVRSWYIEAATCSKDVIILFDVSGSMTGFRNYVARNTLRTLLATLSNNDYINVYTFKNETREAVACFEDLVQATPENLRTIREALQPTDNDKKHKVPLEGYANLTTAYITAFEKLKVRRQNCSTDEENQGCNQLVMLITDYVPGNLTEVFEEYNRETLGNETRIPVRVFTYLIGKEVTNVREIQWMACLNRGYYVHIHSIEEVQQQVLKYINVIARPMILEGEEPPPTWTHAYIDETRTRTWNVSADIDLLDSDKLVTSVAIPAFMSNENSNQTTADLLGVAGTDVPIDSIAKLAQPHQLGVNGYSFIVSNNGYLLLHPSLVTSINGVLQENYNSIDIVEVEQVDDGKGSRQLGEEILALRKAMVDGKTGSLRDIAVLFHYDSMRRIAQVKQNYFYNKLEGTPFSLGISLPDGYGNTYLDVGDIWEVDFGGYGGVKVTSYFNSSYRVHPEWVYCKYHYLEGHEMTPVEKEVWHFLDKMGHPDWVWYDQYTSSTNDSMPFSVETHCQGRQRLDRNAYYCNKDLVQMLVFDAKLTDPYFKKWTDSQEVLEMAVLYDANIRFISTSSGLTRWHYLFDDGLNEVVVNNEGERKFKDDENEGAKAFGDLYPRAIEEIWYMSAVLQHVISEESLVVAVNITSPENEENITDIIVTASHAIFAHDLNEESPASVVGFQFAYANWLARFNEITSFAHLSCEDCIKSCRNGSGHRCYLIDSSGYIVLSENKGDVGNFFGIRQPWVMQNMTDSGYFDMKTVFNYQAVCTPEDLKVNSSGAGWKFGTPFSASKYLVQWFMTQLSWLVTDVLAMADYSDIYDDASFEETHPTSTEAPPSHVNDTNENEQEENFSCDKEIQLYILNQEKLLAEDGTFENTQSGNCTPNYVAVLVKHTNLLFVAVEYKDWNPMPYCIRKKLTTEPTPTEESTISKAPCHKLPLGSLERRRLEGCYTYHRKEAEIDACGLGSLARLNMWPILGGLFVLFSVTRVLLS